MIRRANASWPQPAPLPQSTSVAVVVDRVRRMGSSTVAVVEGSTTDGLDVRCLLGSDATVQLARQVLLGHHPVVLVPAWALLADEAVEAPMG